MKHIIEPGSLGTNVNKEQPVTPEELAAFNMITRMRTLDERKTGSKIETNSIVYGPIGCGKMYLVQKGNPGIKTFQGIVLEPKDLKGVTGKIVIDNYDHLSDSTLNEINQLKDVIVIGIVTTPSKNNSYQHPAGYTKLVFEY